MASEFSLQVFECRGYACLAMGKTVILYHFPTVSRSKVQFFYLNGEKMIFTYDFSWQRTLFVLYTLLPD